MKPKRRRKPITPRSQVRNVLRQLWLRSRERVEALRRTGYTCERCGVKQSVARGREQKVEVHHRAGGIGNWNRVLDIVYEELLCNPDMLEAICPECHEKEHKEEKNE